MPLLLRKNWGPRRTRFWSFRNKGYCLLSTPVDSISVSVFVFIFVELDKYRNWDEKACLYTCPNCEVTTEKVEVEAKSNYHYFRCSCCKSRTSLRYLFVCFHMTICVQISIVVCSRTGTLLFGKKIEMRSFLLIAYFFVATCLTHEQLIHEIDLSCESGTFQLSTGSKTCKQTLVFYHGIFRWLLSLFVVLIIHHQCMLQFLLIHCFMEREKRSLRCWWSCRGRMEWRLVLNENRYFLHIARMM